MITFVSNVHTLLGVSIAWVHAKGCFEMIAGRLEIMRREEGLSKESMCNRVIRIQSQCFATGFRRLIQITLESKSFTAEKCCSGAVGIQAQRFFSHSLHSPPCL